MRVVVLGAGIAGLTTAWYLAEAGVEVTVLDRGEEPATETSHANGGHISTTSAAPWTGPEAVRELFVTCLQRQRPVRVLPARDPGRWRWFARALAASRPAVYRDATSTLRRLAAFSREHLEGLIHEQDLDIALEAQGVLSLYRGERAFRRARRRVAGDDTVRVLGAGEVLEAEPAFREAAARPVGALYYRGDATGDCRRFCVALGARAAARGVEFRFGVEVRDLVRGPNGIRAVQTDAGAVPADACVVALGAGASPLLRRCGVRAPILPLRGYTLSASIPEGATAPGRFVDAQRHVVFSRLGNTFRAAGMADFAGPVRGAPSARLAQLERLAREWYPGLGEPTYWDCLRPMTPDGPPILGASGTDGLWLNIGMGPLGWTLGCGAGRLVADRVLGRKSAMALEGLTLNRFA